MINVEEVQICLHQQIVFEIIYNFNNCDLIILFILILIYYSLGPGL